MFDPKSFWTKIVNYQAAQLSSSNQILPVVVKMSEFSKSRKS